MKFCISKIHLGRYKIEMLDENNQVITGFDGGSALIMILLAKWLFQPEQEQYERDQKRSSDEISDAVVQDMKDNPKKYLKAPSKRIGVQGQGARPMTQTQRDELDKAK